MRVKIAARHCDIPDTLRDRAEEQMTRLSRYDPRLSAAEVIFEEEKRTRRVEVILSVDRDDPVVARAEEEEFRAALDLVVDRLAKQLRRRRERILDQKARRVPQGVPSD